MSADKYNEMAERVDKIRVYYADESRKQEAKVKELESKEQSLTLERKALLEEIDSLKETNALSTQQVTALQALVDTLKAAIPHD